MGASKAPASLHKLAVRSRTASVRKYCDAFGFVEQLGCFGHLGGFREYGGVVLSEPELYGFGTGRLH